MSDNTNLNYPFTVIAADYSQHPINLSVNRGEQVSFTCFYPLDETYVNISWSASNHLQIDLSNSTVTSLNSSTKSELVFTADDSSNSGEYTCIAHLNYSTVTSESATLTVNC